MESSTDNAVIQGLYFRLLDSWNKMDARQFAALFADDANVIGFDGSEVSGRDEIEKYLGRIFSDHTVASYVGIVREIRFLSKDIAVLRAVAGMVPPGENDINSKTNAIQIMIAQKKEGQFRIAVYQNTPAAFHGRPEAIEQLTNELRKELQNLVT